MKHALSPFAVLRHRNFRLLWLGMLVSRIGSEMQTVAVGWQMYLLTGSALSLGLIGLARFIPLLFFALLGGLVADIGDRRKLMIISQSIMACTSTLLMLATSTQQISPPLIYTLIAISAAAMSFDMPTRQALIPTLVPPTELFRAVSINALMWQFSMVIGPALGGLLIASLGISGVYTIDALSFIAVIVALLWMTPLTKPPGVRATLTLASLQEGFRFVRHTPILSTNMLLDFFATFFASATLLLPVYARDILSVGPRGLGLLYSAPAVGSVIASLCLSYIGQLKKQGKIVLLSVTLYGLATILFGISRSFVLSLLFLFLTGFADSVSMVIRHTIRQLATPDHLRGRMSSINLIFSMGGPQLGEFEAGLVASLVGAPASVVFGGLATIIATAFIGLFVPSLRNYKHPKNLSA